MSKSMICRSCQSTRFRQDDENHLFYCVVCGQHFAEFLAEELEFEPSLVAGHGRRIVARANRVVGSEQEMTWRAQRYFFEAFQQVLQAQVNTLIKDFFVSPKLSVTVGRIWIVLLDHLHASEETNRSEETAKSNPGLRVRLFGSKLSFIHHSAVAATRARRKPSTRYDPVTKEYVQVTDDVEEPFAEESSIDLNGASSSQFFPLHTSLAMIWIACICLREPISVADLLRWSAQGRLPYFGCVDAISDALATRVRADAQLLHYFSPVSIVSCLTVRQYALDVLFPSVCQGLGVDSTFLLGLTTMLPAFVERYFHELRLPSILLPLCQRLTSIWLLHHGSKELRLLEGKPFSVEVCAVSFLVLVLRLCYGLSDVECVASQSVAYVSLSSLTSLRDDILDVVILPSFSDFLSQLQVALDNLSSIASLESLDYFGNAEGWSHLGKLALAEFASQTAKYTEAEMFVQNLKSVHSVVSNVASLGIPVASVSCLSSNHLNSLSSPASRFVLYDAHDTTGHFDHVYELILCSFSRILGGMDPLSIHQCTDYVLHSIVECMDTFVL